MAEDSVQEPAGYGASMSGTGDLTPASCAIRSTGLRVSEGFLKPGYSEQILISVCPKTRYSSAVIPDPDPESRFSREIKHLDTGFRAGMTSKR